MKLLIWQFLSDWTRRMSSTRIQQECGFSSLKYLKMPLQHGVLAWFRHIRWHCIAQRIDLKMLGTPWYPIPSTGSSWSPWHLWIEVAMCSALSWIISWKPGHPDLHCWSNSLWPLGPFLAKTKLLLTSSRQLVGVGSSSQDVQINMSETCETLNCEPVVQLGCSYAIHLRQIRAPSSTCSESLAHFRT